MSGTRTERDALGAVEVPAEALWGAATQRAIQNFPVSGLPLPACFIRALGFVKEAAAATNQELRVLDPNLAAAIRQAAREVAMGEHFEQFPVDVFQTGSGTSTNMNANEVIANRAAQILGEAGRVHPNDHVNASQSSNDVIPTALHVAARREIHGELLPALRELHASLLRKAAAFQDVVKPGRTHLMDAVPVRLGQEFAGWARQVELGIARVEAASEALAEIPLGGTAVGTGLNCPPGFARKTVARLGRRTELAFREAGDRFEAQGARDAAVAASGALRTLAVSLAKIAGDLRLLGSGPRCGLGELRLPAVQPGSSLMPGKVNPVICESVIQVSAQVIGNDTAVMLGGLGGQLELNATLPLIARNLLESIQLLANVARVFAARCIDGIEVDREAMASGVERSLALVSVLAPAIGYDAAAEIAREAWESGRNVLEVCLERRVLPRERLEALLDPLRQTQSGGV
jgi:fumarate hydratase class II